MGLPELFAAVLIAGVSAVNAAVPLAAWGRSHDVRFLWIAGGNSMLLVLGALWTWGELPVDPPVLAPTSPVLLVLVLVTALCLFVAGLWPRRS